MINYRAGRRGGLLALAVCTWPLTGHAQVPSAPTLPLSSGAVITCLVPQNNGYVPRGCSPAVITNFAPPIDIRAFGAAVDGATDDEPAWIAAIAYLTAAGGGTLTMPVGTSIINTSHCVGGLSPLQFPNNVTIQGQGYNASNIATSGAAQCSELLTFLNPNNDWVRDLSLASNQVSVTQGIPGLILFEEAANAPGPRYQNFGADGVFLGKTSDNYKASVINLGAYPMESVSFTHMKCVFVSGDDQNPTSVSVPSDCIESYGQYNNVGGVIKGLIVSDGYGDGTWGKRFCTIWSGNVGAHCDRNYLSNFGAQTSANTNTGAYALLSYNISADVSGVGQPSQDVWFVDNAIVNPYSDGIYCEDTVNCASSGNHISGQTDTGDATIPKAGISYNGSTGEIDHNILTNNFRDIVVIPEGTIGTFGIVTIDHNTGTGNVANAQGIVVRGNGLGAFAADVTVLDNNTDLQTGTASVGTYWFTGGGSVIGNIIATGGHYQGTGIDLRTFDTSTSHGVVATSLYIGGGMLLDGAPATSMINLETTATPAVIDGVILDLTSVPTASNGGYFLAETALTINNLIIRNATTSGQKPITLSGARGSMPVGALQFQNVTVSPRFVSTDFGFASPSGSWSADSGTVIAAINPSTGVQGWQNVGGSTAWFPLGGFGTGGALVSATAPTVTSGLGTGPAPVVLANGTAAFQITVGGSTPTAPTTTEFLAMPTAAHGYACSVRDVTTPADTAQQTGAVSASAVTFTWNNAPTGADVLVHNCTQF